MASNSVNINKLVQGGSVVPVCRVHVYQNNFVDQARSRSESKLPRHWAGRHAPGADVPSFILGKEGIYKQPHPVLKKNAGARMEWELLDARVNITRQWSCSSAMFQIARPVEVSTPPEAPPVRPNDVIVIEMGYVRGLDTRVSTPTGQTNYNVFAGDVVFFGIVDTVKERGGSGERDGIVVTVEARDTMSFLIDNKIRGHYRPQNLNNYNRAFIVRDLILRGAAIDYIKWKQVNGDYIYDEFGFKKPAMVDEGEQFVEPEVFSPDNCYVEIGTLERSSRTDVEIPEEGNQTGIPLMDKFPLDVIRHFSLVEPAPREMWADPRTGRINWMYRRTDMRRLLNDPPARQYFYMYPPDRANILSYTNEWSTAGTITHFTVTNPLAATSNEAGTKEIYAESPTASLIDPHTNLPLRTFTRNRFIYDDTLTGNDEPQSVAAALFTIWGRAIETGMVMVPGDPTMNIGEAIQVFNTGLFGRRYHEGLPDTLNNSYADAAVGQLPNPEGIYRVEAITHLFAIGGVGTGYKTVYVFGPCDTDTGSAEAKRLMKSDQDWAAVQHINVNDLLENGQGTGGEGG